MFIIILIDPRSDFWILTHWRNFKICYIFTVEFVLLLQAAFLQKLEKLYYCKNITTYIWCTTT